jgi:hypothetical protein
VKNGQQESFVTRGEIVDQVIDLLRSHAFEARGSAMVGSIHQEPYKHDFFTLFAAAFNNGMMRGSGDVLNADALLDSIKERAPELLHGEAWRNLYTFWSEWTYAWRHASELEHGDH